MGNFQIRKISKIYVLHKINIYIKNIFLYIVSLIYNFLVCNIKKKNIVMLTQYRRKVIIEFHFTGRNSVRISPHDNNHTLYIYMNHYMHGMCNGLKGETRYSSCSNTKIYDLCLMLVNLRLLVYRCSRQTSMLEMLLSTITEKKAKNSASSV